MLATRVGAGIAAEIGSMVVTEQVDALRMCAADPIDFLIVPRFLASILMTLVPRIDLVGDGRLPRGAVTAVRGATTCRSQTFFNGSLVDAGDIVHRAREVHAWPMAPAIPIVSGYCDLSTFGGSEGVGWATRAVVNTSLAICIILNFFISGAGFLIFPG